MDRRTCRAVSLLLAGLLPLRALASGTPEEVIARLDAALREQAARLQAQHLEIERLQASVEALRMTAGRQSLRIEDLGVASRHEALRREESARVSIAGSRPTIQAPDGRTSFASRGLVQLDSAYYRQSGSPSDTDFRRGSVGAGGRENAAAGDLSSGTNFRRARMGFEGAFSPQLSYRLLGEFGGSGSESQVRLSDAWIAYTGLAPLTLQAGAFAPPANLDDGTPAEDTLFPERSTPAELSRSLAGADGRLALALRANGARWMSAFSLTGAVAGEAESFDEQRALVGRLGGLALQSEDYNVHLGVSGSHVLRPADQGGAVGTSPLSIRLRERPELRVDGARLVDTGPIPADSAWVRGLEFAANWRNFYLQAEQFRFGVGRNGSPLSDPEFGGYYVQGSWIITGESRRYSSAHGAFLAPRPRLAFSAGEGPGAWELAWRYSHTDLDYEAGVPGSPPPPGGVRGGTQRILSVGLNWTPEPNLRLMLDYMNVEIERLNPATPGSIPFGPAPATPPVGVAIGQDFDILNLRTQLAF